MKLRAITIWTTWLLLPATFLVPFGCFIITDPYNTAHLSLTGTLATIISAFGGGVGFWLFSAVPLGVSFLIARKLKHDIPSVVLIAPVIGYAVWLGNVYHREFFGRGHWHDDWIVFAITAVCLLTPVWIFAWGMDWYAVKKASAPPKPFREPRWFCRIFIAVTILWIFGGGSVFMLQDIPLLITLTVGSILFVLPIFRWPALG